MNCESMYEYIIVVCMWLSTIQFNFITATIQICQFDTYWSYYLFFEYTYYSLYVFSYGSIFNSQISLLWGITSSFLIISYEEYSTWWYIRSANLRVYWEISPYWNKHGYCSLCCHYVHSSNFVWVCCYWQVTLFNFSTISWTVSPARLSAPRSQHNLRDRCSASIALILPDFDTKPL